jgi:hypothetical protein
VKDLSHFCCFSKKQDPNQSKPKISQRTNHLISN